MKSDTILIDNQGNGFKDAIEQTKRAAQFRGLNAKETLQLQLCTEEMLCLARSVTGEMKASFWLECEGKHFDLHMSTKTVMDIEKREQLLSSSTSRKNEAAKSFLGKLRDAFEEAMLSDPDYYDDIPTEAMEDLANRVIELNEWDKYEQSILQKVADEVKIGIVRNTVDMTVSKSF